MQNKFSEISGEPLEYIGSKIVKAMPMILGAYNDFRGWKLPEDEDGETAGYVIEYPDGYVSWCPASQFEEANRPTFGMSLGHAIEAMIKGNKVARAGWNGKNMFLIYVPGTNDAQLKEATPYHRALCPDITGQGTVDINPHIDMMTATGEFQPGWLASQTDMLALDWQIVE